MKKPSDWYATARRNLAFVSVLLASALALAPPARAVVTRHWTPLGPFGGEVGSLAIDPGDSETLFAGTFTGRVFRSTDGGESWSAVAGVAADAPIRQLLVVPSDPQRVYAGGLGFLYRSLDGGGSFELLASGLGPVAAVPGDPSQLYAASSNGVQVSHDGGETFAPLPGFPHFSEAPDRVIPAFSVAVDPGDSTVLYAGTSRGVWKSDDRGASWSDLSAGLPEPPSQSSIFQVVVSAGSPQAVWLRTPFSLDRSTDGGRTWLAATAGLPAGHGELRELTLDAAGPAAAYLAAESGLYHTSDGGAHWATVDLGTPVAVRSVAIAPSAARTLFAGTTGGVLRSGDGGASWEEADRGLAAIPVRSVAADPEEPETLFAVPGRPAAADTMLNDLYGGLQEGLWVMRAGVDGWQREVPPLTFEELPTLTFEGVGVAVRPASPQEVYAATPGRLLHSADGGRTWEEAGGLPVDSWTFFVGPPLLDPADPGVLWAEVLSTPNPLVSLDTTGVYLIYRSLDAGSTWEPLPSFPRTPDTRRVPLAVGTGEPPLLWTVAPGGVYRSSDRGSTWSLAGSGSGLASPADVSALTADPHDAGTLYAATPQGLLVSRDAGASFTPVAGGLPPSAGVRLLVDPEVAGHLYAATPAGGLFASRDDGVSWEDIGGDLPPDLRVYDLTLAGKAPRVLLLGTDQGVYRTTVSGCAANERALCLGGGRFQVEVDWQDFQGHRGSGRAVPLTDDSGTFWFFSPNNLELLVKVLDARSLDGRFWVFYGALTNVAYTLRVTDTATGRERVYENPSGRFASRGDTDAFVGEDTLAPFAASRVLSLPDGTLAPLAAPVVADMPAPECGGGPGALCLGGGRFRLEVSWKDFQGGSGNGHGQALTADSGTFWFFSPQNLELEVKVLDARVLNGHFWVFVGALTNVAYELRVTDTLTHETRVYDNPAGRFASFGDTAAF